MTSGDKWSGWGSEALTKALYHSGVTSSLRRRSSARTCWTRASRAGSRGWSRACWRRARARWRGSTPPRASWSPRQTRCSAAPPRRCPADQQLHVCIHPLQLCEALMSQRMLDDGCYRGVRAAPGWTGLKQHGHLFTIYLF